MLGGMNEWTQQEVRERSGRDVGQAHVPVIRSRRIFTWARERKVKGHKPVLPTGAWRRLRPKERDEGELDFNMASYWECGRNPSSIMMLGLVAEGFDPDEVNRASETVWVKNTLCCAKLSFVMVLFSLCFVNISEVPQLPGPSLKAFPPLFYSHFGSCFEYAVFAIFPWLWWYVNPDLPGDKRGLTEKSRKLRKLSQFFLTSNDFSHAIFDTQNIKDEKSKWIIYNPEERKRVS